MASEQKTMAALTCRYCRSDCETAGGLVLRPVGWVCDECDRFDDSDLDVEGWEERRRQRLAEAQEY